MFVYAQYGFMPYAIVLTPHNFCWIANTWGLFTGKLNLPLSLCLNTTYWASLGGLLSGVSAGMRFPCDLPCWGVSRSVTHKYQRWIWFTLSYALLKALLRLAVVRETKQAGELRGDTVHFIASSSALVLMMQNGSIYRPLTPTATCLLRVYSNKHIVVNS